MAQLAVVLLLLLRTIMVPMVPKAVPHRLYRAMITVPPGAIGGMNIHVQTPAGLMEAMVPLGLQPGMVFAINFPVAVEAGAPAPAMYTASQPPPQPPAPPPQAPVPYYGGAGQTMPYNNNNPAMNPAAAFNPFFDPNNQVAPRQVPRVLR